MLSIITIDFMNMSDSVNDLSVNESQIESSCSVEDESPSLLSPSESDGTGTPVQA